jgi:hypothetical protein
MNARMNISLVSLRARGGLSVIALAKHHRKTDERKYRRRTWVTGELAII